MKVPLGKNSILLGAITGLKMIKKGGKSLAGLKSIKLNLNNESPILTPTPTLLKAPLCFVLLGILSKQRNFNYDKNQIY